MAMRRVLIEYPDEILAGIASPTSLKTTNRRRNSDVCSLSNDATLSSLSKPEVLT